MIKKICLENLPKKKGYAMHGDKLVIDWENSIGEKVRFTYDNIEGFIEIINYESKDQMLTIKYEDEIDKIKTYNLVNCQLGRILKVITSDFKIEIGTRFQDEKRDIAITDKKKIQSKTGQWKKYYKYHCNKCGFDCGEHLGVKDGKYNEEFWIAESSLKAGSGCVCCCKPTHVVVQGINDIPTTNPEMVKYFIGGYNEAKLYNAGSSKKIFVKCPECGTVKSKKINIGSILVQGIGCSCSDGILFPNKTMLFILKQLQINFINEYNPNWCKFNFKNKLRQGYYDFYFHLNKNKYIIEMDGGFHNNDNKKSGQSAIESKFIDDEKDRLAIENGIKVIRIDCDYSNIETRFEFIKQNILKNKELNKIFDLSIIDWNEVNKFAVCNLVKVACDYKKNNPDLTSSEISKIMGNCSTSTVVRWLNLGNKFGWCVYNGEIELKKAIKKMHSMNNKKVQIYKGNVFLGEFNSGKDLERKSKTIFGVQLLSCDISKVCNGVRAHHKGFTFKYID